jgi:hypothetical protein
VLELLEELAGARTVGWRNDRRRLAGRNGCGHEKGD